MIEKNVCLICGRKYKKTSRMTEEKAVVILMKVREYYSLKRQGYDDVIKWLEGRIKRRKKLGTD